MRTDLVAVQERLWHASHTATTFAIPKLASGPCTVGVSLSMATLTIRGIVPVLMPSDFE